MKISILTQYNHFLINASLYSLLKKLELAGVEATVYFTSASPRGRSTSKISEAISVFKIMGGVFFLRMLLAYATSMMLYNRARFSQICKVVILEDDTALSPQVFDRNCCAEGGLLILSGTRIIKKEVLEYFNGDVINVHSSILPYSQGLMPAYWTYHQRKGCGVTLFRLDEGIDTGEVIAQVEIHNPHKSYFGYLWQTKAVGVDLLYYWVLEYVLNFRVPSSINQTYNKFPEKKWLNEGE